MLTAGQKIQHDQRLLILISAHDCRLRNVHRAASIVAAFTSPTVARQLSLAEAGEAHLPECALNQHGTGLYITPFCFDPDYSTAIIDDEIDKSDPVPHRKISGHFEPSGDDFNIYLPPSSQWDGRFFQLVYPTQNSSATDFAVGFGVDSGGYTVQVRSFGYRGNAAAARLSRQIAREYYDQPNQDIHGYVYGGSGGSLQTVGAVENTDDIWDGAVILIQAVPFSNPNNFPIRALGGLVMAEDKDKIIESLRPGASGDPFSILPSLSRAILEECTALGVPLRAWENFEDTGSHKTQVWGVIENMVIPAVKAQDPTFADDFWARPGYLGSEQSELGDFFRRALIEFDATVVEVIYDSEEQPIGIRLDHVPLDADGMPGLEVTLPPVERMNDSDTERTFFSLFSSENNSCSLPADINATWVPSLIRNATLKVDNRRWLAVHTLHRHQVPPPSLGLYGYDYLRDDNGKPLYPQRDVLLGPGISQSASGGAVHSGNITAKVIIMDTLLDPDAFPWHADWYKNQVAQDFGEECRNNFRLYYTDNADHQMEFVSGPRSAQIVDFIGTYEQHLRDLSFWVEKGIEPPEATNYTIVDGQVAVPSPANDRQGIQPTVQLEANGLTMTEVKVGEPVNFLANAEVPLNTGSLVKVEWDFYGNGKYVDMDIEAQQSSIQIRTEHSYMEVGVYLPVIRVTAHRKGDTATPFALVKNLARVQVVVQR